MFHVGHVLCNRFEITRGDVPLENNFQFLSVISETRQKRSLPVRVLVLVRISCRRSWSLSARFLSKWSCLFKSLSCETQKRFCTYMHKVWTRVSFTCDHYIYTMLVASQFRMQLRKLLGSCERWLYNLVCRDFVYSRCKTAPKPFQKMTHLTRW